MNNRAIIKTISNEVESTFNQFLMNVNASRLVDAYLYYFSVNSIKKVQFCNYEVSQQFAVETARKLEHRTNLAPQTQPFEEHFRFFINTVNNIVSTASPRKELNLHVLNIYLHQLSNELQSSEAYFDSAHVIEI